MICVPVAGPWVVVPTGRSVPRPRVEYQLRCPRGYVVGGLDAELSDRAIEVDFLGKMGSPVNPGITTGRTAVFVATYVGGSARAPSFRPHIGCMPASGGGGRLPTSLRRRLGGGDLQGVRALPARPSAPPSGDAWILPTRVAAVFPPGRPTVRRVRTVRVLPGERRVVVQRCAPGERLVGASHARGLYIAKPPSARLAAGVAVRQAVRGDAVAVTVRGAGSLRGVRAVVQIHANCAGGQ
jgi:hypothetical protein